ncbi:MAG TPA: hypothetical protein VL982_12725 [Burkholderiales bacterium]|jgi:hypothetical protein|nr:hypothetical protein [Burkholderiales bacterium]
MFLLFLSASLTFGAALLVTVSFTEGALLALRTAAEIIGWLLLLAAVAGLAGLRYASFGRVCAASVTLCSGLAVLYMSYFFEWNELQRPVARHAVAQAAFVRPVAYAYTPIEPLAAASAVALPAEVENSVKASAPRPKPVAATRRIALVGPPDACSTLNGVESLQCTRCSEKLGFARVTCQESVRLKYCETELGDERTCPSPVPQSYPG